MAAEALTLRVHGIGAHGEGVGRLDDGRTVFVHRTAPGDLVSVEIVRSERRWARARLLRVLEATTSRRDPPCALYDTCGGCSLQHLPYADQLEVKRDRVAQALERIGGVRVDVGAVAPSPEELAYRTRVTFHLRRLAGGRVVAGFHEVGNPRRVVDVDARCLIVGPVLARTWQALRDAWGPDAGFLPAGAAIDLTLQEVDDGVVLLVRGGRGRGDAPAILRSVSDLVAIWLDDRGGPRLLAGSPTASLHWNEDDVTIRPSAFLQANRHAADMLWRAMSAEIGDVAGLRVIDGYAGVGAFARAWARSGAEVTAIELNREAARSAALGAPPGLRVVVGSVEAHLSRHLPADVVVLNPPRTGVAERVVQVLLEARPGRLLYVSCDPATLARDLDRLSSGFDVVRLQALDLFPQTAHVEAVVTLERGT